MLAQRGGLDFEQVVAHFMRVNHCSHDEFEAYSAQAFDLWRKRSQEPWTLDLGKYAHLLSAEQPPAPDGDNQDA